MLSSRDTESDGIEKNSVLVEIIRKPRNNSKIRQNRLHNEEYYKRPKMTPQNDKQIIQKEDIKILNSDAKSISKHNAKTHKMGN